MATTKDKIRERRLERMRLGQAVAEVVPLPSDSEIKLHIVPLTEADFINALNAVAAVEKSGDEIAGYALRERKQAQEVLARAIREPDDLRQRVFASVDEMNEELDVGDIDKLWDEYNYMTAQSSPSLDAIPNEELVRLKELLQTMDWNALSGKAWYAARRFLSEISPMPLLVNSPGSGSTNS